MSAPGYQVPRDPTAVMGLRILAYIVDAGLMLALLLLLSPLGFLGEYVEGANDVDDPCGQLRDTDDTVWNCVTIGDRAYFTSGSETVIGSVVPLVYVIAVFVIWQGVSGLTIGKALASIRVVGEDGQPPGVGRAFVRTILWVVDSVPWIFPAVGLISALTSTGHRRVGDMAAKTYVVGKADAGRPVVVPGAVPAFAGVPGYGPAPGYGAPAGYGAPTGYPAGPPTAPWSGGGPPSGPTPLPPAAGWGPPPTPGGTPPGGTPAGGTPATATPSGWPAPPAPPAPAPAPATNASGGFGTPATPSEPAPSGEQPAAVSDALNAAAPGTTGWQPSVHQPAAPPGDTAPSAPAPSTGTEGSPGTEGLAAVWPGPRDEAAAAEPPAEKPTEGAEATDEALGAAAPAGRSEETAPTPAEPTAGTSTTAGADAGAVETGAEATPAPDGAETAGAEQAAGAEASQAQTYNPQWDAARGTYIQWDAARGHWLQWDDAAKQWKAL